MRFVMRSHSVCVAGSLAVAWALSACGAAREAADDLLDGLRDASLGLPDANLGWEAGQVPSDGSAWDAAVGGDSSVDGASSDAGADGGSDAETTPSACGDGVLAQDESCDTAIAAGSAGACPTSCAPDAPNACARAMLVGTGCSAHCEQSTIAACANDDGCCANGCTPSNDDDCEAICGNGVLEGSELCDGNCPSSCDDNDACTTDGATGDVSSCDRACVHDAIATCQGGDGCCAPGCNSGNDSDCSASCGDDVVDNGERCDGNCPTSCNDGDACTSDVLSGMPAQCNVQCTSTAISACVNGDGCCPSTCRGNNDDDCPSMCGNGAVEPGEECEPTSSNDPSCSSNCLLPASECLNRAEGRGEDPSDACVACGCDECTNELQACYEATDVAAGGPAAGVSRATLCIDLVTCGRTSGCTGSGCLSSCRTQIERAAESTSLLTILSRQSNTNYAIGRANAVSECSVDNCATPCEL